MSAERPDSQRPTARQLLNALLETTVQQPEATHALFADDGVYEAPYLESLGLPWRYRGRREVAERLDAVRELFPQLAFHDVEIVAETTGCVVAEYQFTTWSSRTERMIHQLIVGRLEAADGKITLLRESLNLVEMALALYPYGLADYNIPSDRDV